MIKLTRIDKLGRVHERYYRDEDMELSENPFAQVSGFRVPEEWKVRIWKTVRPFRAVIRPNRRKEV